MPDVKKALPAAHKVGDEVELVRDVSARPEEWPWALPAGLRGVVTVVMADGRLEVRFASRNVFVVVDATDVKKVK